MDSLSPKGSEQFSRALGDAVVRIWSHLPQDIQHDLFEHAMTSQGEAMRADLALFLHNKHPRTAAAAKARAMLEPDSLGG